MLSIKSKIEKLKVKFTSLQFKIEKKLKRNFLFLFIFRIYTKRICYLKTKKIKLNLKNKKESFIIIDLLNCPPTFGDLIFFISWARYLKCLTSKVKIIIISSELRINWKNLSIDQRNTFLKQLFEFFNLLVDKNTSIKVTSWHSFKKEILNKCDPIWKSEFSKRGRFYLKLPNILSSLFLLSPNIFESKVLFKKDEFKNKKNEKILKSLPPFITLACRYNKSYRLDSNTSIKQLNELCSTIWKVFPSHVIVILSDEIGCNYYKEKFKPFGNKLYYANELLTEFQGSVTLSMYSDIHLQLKGGGVSVPRILSKLPYIIFSPAFDQRNFNRQYYGSWSKEYQYYLNSNLYSVQLLTDILNKLKKFI